MATEKTASFPIRIEDGVSGPSEAAADSLEALRAKLEANDSAIRAMVADYRKLRGSTEEIKAAKVELGNKIGALRDQNSSLVLSLQKAGTSYNDLAAKAKAAAAAEEKLKADTEKLNKELDAKKKKEAADAIAAMKQKTADLNKAVAMGGGPLASLNSQVGAFGELATSAIGPQALLVVGIGAVVAAVVALTSALVSGTIALAKWIAEAANARRTAGLLREGLLGSAEWAKNLGDHVDQLAKKVPTAKDHLNELANSLARGGMRGQLFVDTLNAVAQASAAVGDETGNKLRGLVERGFDAFRQRGFFALNPRELVGTGLQFDDIAKQLAKSTGKGINEARAALFRGRVPIGQGAAALRAAVEEKFGQLNARKMLDLNVIGQKFKETLDNLTKDVNLEPMLEAFKDLASVFDTSTVTGRALKDLITRFGNEVSKAFKAAEPYAKAFIKGMVIGALELAIVFYKVRNQLRDTFGNSDTLKNIDGISVAVTAGKYAMYALAAAIGAVVLGIASLATTMAIATAPIWVPFVVAGAAIWAVYENLKKTWELLKSIDWAGIGKSIADGLVKGLRSVVDGVKNMASDIKDAFKNALGIHSPSRVFAEYGQMTAAGFAQGVGRGSDEAHEAVEAMAPAPPAAPRGGGGGAASKIEVNLTIHVNGGGDAAKTLSDETFLAKVTKAIEDALVGAGIPVQA